MSAHQLTVLWDIDGTLLDVRGAGRRAFVAAVAQVWGGARDLRDVSFAGATDLGVLAQVLEPELVDDARTARFFEQLGLSLADELAASPARACVAARETTAALAARGVAQGLLTGNEERCARLKLRSAGFDEAWFTFGAYGHEHADRDQLARVAARRRPGRHVVVGDTPRDVQAARAIDAIAIAVCTGFAERRALVDACPDHLLDDLSGLLALL